MTDETNQPTDEAPAPEAASGPSGGDASGEDTWSTPPGDEAPGSQGREWLAQLQHMIDRVTAEAGPVARDVAAKAAELAAVAGEKAGPFARRAADVTGDVGTRVAERSRRFADDMRHRAAEGEAPPPDAPADAPPAEAGAEDVPPAEETPPA